ncbi:MAG: nucleotidyltransferase domain-containing protein [Acidobacteriota bacterium]
MKMPAAATTIKRSRALRRTRFNESDLPLEVRDLRRRFREWHESSGNRAKRMAYIRRLTKRIAEACGPEGIILFGSFACGNPTPESDVDLLIVMDYEGSPLEQMQRIRRDLDLVAPVDLLVRSPTEVRDRVEDGDMFMIDILRRGKVLYEAKHD